MTEIWQEAFANRFGDDRFGSDAIGLFALALRFGVEDLDAVGAESIVGGGDDKKCDILYFDPDERRCVIAQCYVSTSKKRLAAPANKASDLNTAVAWLLSKPLGSLPARLRAGASQIRDAIKDGKLDELYIWYVHNLPESKNVENEISAVEHTASAAARQINIDATPRIFAQEFGSKRFDRLYRESESPILVAGNVDVIVQAGFKLSGHGWWAYQTIVPGEFFHSLYKKHGTSLFSANIRDYLGSRSSDSNINNGIKHTAETEPKNFWAFNNGITALVNNLTPRKLATGRVRLTLSGISVVNGAQTTGAIGSLIKKPSKDLQVPVRFIWTNKDEIVEGIVKYNNSQNKISASDFRSTDAVQKRLKLEFEKIPDAEYEGGRRGGASDAIKRRPNLLPSYTVGQALAAFHGEPVTAYDRKSEIWINDRTYSNFFKDETTATHIVFAYSLFKAIGGRKVAIVSKTKVGEDLTQIEKAQLDFFEKKGSILLMCAGVSQCLEIILGKAIPNKFRLSFGLKVSPAAAEELWSTVLEPLFPLVTQLSSAFSTNRVATDLAKTAIPKFTAIVAAVSQPNSNTFRAFAKKVIVT